MPEEVFGRTAWAELADKLRDMIIAGELAPGERLVEAEIAERFGLSRGPVRTALTWLQQSGLVEIPSRRGVVVIDMTPDDVTELYDVRIALEQAAVNKLVARSESLDWGKLEADLQLLERLSSEGDRLGAVRADLAFHRDLCELSGNRRLLRLWESIADQIRLVMGTLQAADSATIEPLLHDHRKIFGALTSPQPSDAASLLAGHLDATREVMMEKVSRKVAARQAVG